MIKAVFFDWFNTLAHLEPPRENLQSQAFREFGIDVSPRRIMSGLLIADRYYFEENAAAPIRDRSPQEQAEVYLRYQEKVLSGAGISPPDNRATLSKIMQRVQELSKNMSFALFDDVLPVLAGLKARRLTLGLLSNIDREMGSILTSLGLEPYINFTVTSGEVGADKPEPPIFLTALKKAGVDAAAAVHVGDQYQLDVIGARRAGINPVLIDRFNQHPAISDCPRIRGLTELTPYLE